MKNYKITVNIEEIVGVDKNELKKCSDDLVYMIENYLYIVDHEDNKLKPFKLVKKQKEVLKDIIENNKVIVNKHRQVGETVLEDAIIACSMYLYERDDKKLRIILVAPRRDMVTIRLKRIGEFLNQLVGSNLNEEIKIMELNVKKIFLSNNTSVEHKNLKLIDSNELRYYNANNAWLFVDEMAFITDETNKSFLHEKATYNLWFSKIILTSTKNDLDDLFLPIYMCYKELQFKKIDISYEDVIGENSFIKQYNIISIEKLLTREEFNCEFGDSLIGNITLDKLKKYTNSINSLRSHILQAPFI